MRFHLYRHIYPITHTARIRGDDHRTHTQTSRPNRECQKSERLIITPHNAATEPRDPSIAFLCLFWVLFLLVVGVVVAFD